MWAWRESRASTIRARGPAAARVHVRRDAVGLHGCEEADPREMGSRAGFLAISPL